MPPVLVLAQERVVADRLAWHLGLHPFLDGRGHRRHQAADVHRERVGAREIVPALAEALGRRNGNGTAPVVVSDVPAPQEHQALRELIEELDISVVHLRQPNVVRSALARAARQQLRRHNGRSAPSLPTELRPWRFRGQAFTKLLRGAEIEQAMLQGFIDDLPVQRVVTVDEDALLREEEKTMAEVFRGLDLRPLDFRPRLMPYGDEVLLTATDIDELRSHLDGTDYRPLLDELLHTSRSAP